MGIGGKSLRITALLLLVALLGVIGFGHAATASAAEGAPDLIIFDITPLPENPSTGDAVTISVTVKNQGTGPAGSSRLNIEVDGNSLGGENLGTIAAGASVVKNFSWTAVIGTHTFTAIADATSQVAESVEANNVKTFTLSTQAPDFIIQSITWEPEEPSRGDSIEIEAVIKNLGSGLSKASRVNLFVDGNSRGYRDVPVLNPGATAKVNYSWVATDGQHEIRVMADEEQKIAETNESNNVLTATFSTLAADLLVDWVKWEPKNPSLNEDVTFTINIKNRGEGRSDACHVTHYLEDQLIQTDYLAALEPDKSANLTLTRVLTEDFPGIRVVIDANADVVESSEENNEYTINLQALQPDLVVTDISWDPTDAAVGDTVTVSIAVKNQGSGATPASQLSCHIGAEYQGYASVPAMNTGEYRTIDFTWKSQAGSHEIKADIDANDSITESNEDNNTRTAEFFIIPPDLVIRYLTWEPEEPALDDKVDFTLNIANEGSGEAQNFQVNYFMDSEMLGTNFVSSLPADTAANITFDWTATLGKHEFRAIVDATYAVSEHVEDNNEYSVTIIPTVPDLAVEKITWSPAEITTGDTVTVTITIRNSGTDRARPFRNAYYIDNSIAGYQDVPELPAGEAVSQNIIWTAEAGLHDIRVALDFDNRVTEIKEDNNIRTVYFPPPDLTITNVSISPQQAAVGEPVTIKITMENRGTSKAFDANAGYFVNGEFGDSIGFADMAPGDVVTGELIWLAGAGPCDITVAADADKLVMESDESNNEQSLHYGTLTSDLTIEDIICTQENPADNDDITFSVIIGNRGDYAAGKSRVAFYIDGEQVGQHEVSAVPAGETITEVFHIVVESGEHTIKAIADATELIPESDESNNELEKAYSTITADLAIDGLKWSPTEAMIGDSVIFTVPVKNQGRAAARNVHVALYVDGQEAGSHDILEIGRGETITKQFDWVALPGSHEIRVMLDMDNIVVESNEDNNTEVRTISLPEAPGTTPSPSPTESGGLLDELWWLLYVTAFVFGGIAFYAVLRTAKKGPK